MNLEKQASAVLKHAAAVTGFDLSRDTLVIGFSGGPDSLALLHVLRRLMPDERIVVGHLDHALRPSSSSEAETAARLARGLRFHSERIDIAALARSKKLSIEEAGRLARYDFLARLARGANSSCVAVGHNADDQVETILMHFLRGSGPTGLRGIQPVSRLPGTRDLWLVRPLLDVTRDEITAYCAENNLQPIIDDSNTDTGFRRNRLRHELLPLLETYNPKIRLRLREAAGLFAADDDLLDELTLRVWEDGVEIMSQNALAISREKWRGLPLSLRRRLLRKAVTRLRPDLSDTGIRTLEGARHVADDGETGARATLPGGLALIVQHDRILLDAGDVDFTAGTPQLPPGESRHLSVPGVIELENGWLLTARTFDAQNFETIKANDDPWTAYIDAGAALSLIVRPRQPGDRIRPLGLGGTTKLKKVMIDRRIPAAARKRWPLVATSDHVIWLVGHVVDERAKVREDSLRVIRLRCWLPGEYEAG